MDTLITRLLLLVAITNVQSGIVFVVNNDYEIENNEIPEYMESNLGSKDLPDPDNIALMARFVVHQSNWTSIGYSSTTKKVAGQPLVTLFAVSDGPVEKSTGVPYFYVSPLQSAVDDLLSTDGYCTLLMTLAQGDICTKNGWDPEDPRCAFVVLTGTFEKLNNQSSEIIVAANAMFTRHPGFENLPADHHFFLAKFNIESITIQDNFGGPRNVPVSDYFEIPDDSFWLNVRIK